MYADKISIAYGTEKSAQQALGLTGGWGTAAIEANFVHGTKSTWGWNLVAHTENYSGDSIDSTFSVTVENIISIKEGPPQDPPCDACGNCGEFLHNKDDHYLGVCPLDPSVAGCGKRRWSCETSKQLAWHQIRFCYHAFTLPLPLVGGPTGICPEKFRHCKNPSCDFRAKPERGHSDGTQSEPPPGVSNLTADSHLIDEPPSPITPATPVGTPPGDGDDGDGVLVSNPSSSGLSPTNGSYYAAAGDTHEATVITSEAYYYVHWYVASPNDPGLGTFVETDEGWSTGGTATEASLSYTFPSDAVSGGWTITAVSERYSDLSQGSTRSYTVTVE